MSRFTTKRGQGFTLLELLIYIAITTLMLAAVANITMTTIRLRGQARAQELILQTARTVSSLFTQQFHLVDSITDITPDPAVLHFELANGGWFTLQLNNGDLLFTRNDMPSEALNSNVVSIDDFTLTPVYDSQAADIRGIQYAFTLTVGTSTSPFSYVTRSYQSSLSLR